MRSELIDITKEFISRSTPGIGSISYEDGLDIKTHVNEIRTARWLLNTFGGHITVLKEKNIYMVSNPDFEWNTKYWELKHLRKSSSLDTGIKTACKQIKTKPGGIIIDIDGYKNISNIKGIIVDRLNRNPIKNCYIVIKNNDFLLNVYEYKKRS